MVSYEKEKYKQGRDLTRITGDKEKTESLEHRIEREGEWMRMDVNNELCGERESDGPRT